MLLEVLCTLLLTNLTPTMSISPPKYFAVDIDDTFYTENKDAMQRNIDAFQKAISQGYKLFFCTGRHPSKASPRISPDFAEKTGYNGCPGVYQNGAIVVDERHNVISKVTLPREFIDDLLEFMKENKVGKSFRFSDDQRVYIANDIDGSGGELIDNVVSFASECQVSWEAIKNLDITRIRYHNCVKLEEFTKYANGVDFTLKRSDKTSLITAAGVTKAFGLRKLCEHLGINPEDVGFIGDGLNDIEAMELSNHSYAVGNAHPQVKKHAKHVLNETCDQAAFAKAMALVYGV